MDILDCAVRMNNPVIQLGNPCVPQMLCSIVPTVLSLPLLRMKAPDTVFPNRHARSRIEAEQAMMFLGRVGELSGRDVERPAARVTTSLCASARNTSRSAAGLLQCACAGEISALRAQRQLSSCRPRERHNQGADRNQDGKDRDPGGQAASARTPCCNDRRVGEAERRWRLASPCNACRRWHSP